MKQTIFLLISLIGAASAQTQQKKEVHSRITYISGTNIYMGAGNLDHISVGDTARIFKNGSEIGSATITAIADSSCAASYHGALSKFTVGDSVTIDVWYESAQAIASEQANNKSRHAMSNAPQLQKSSVPVENILTGRIAVQYEGVIAEESKFDLNQPALMLQMRLGNLFGTGTALSIYDRGFYSTPDDYSLYGNRKGFQQNLYDFSLTRENENSPLGFGLGRLASRFVGGLGTFDGAQIYYRIDKFTAGLLGGAAANIPSSVLNFSGTKTAAFLNYHTSEDVSHQYDGTLAYGVQTVGGKLDRDFLYLQNMVSLGPKTSVYESSEIDLSELSNGARKTAFNFSNTFLSVNYYPEEWLFANLGYDASREVYLFQTMRTIPDSLVDRNILQGFRGSVTADLSGEFTLSANGSYRTEKGFARNERTLGGTIRGRDLLETGMNAALQYTSFVGAFTNGGDFSFELDRTFFYSLSLTLRYDSYNVTVSTVQQSYSTQTLTGYVDFYISPRWFTSIGVDDIIDATMNSVQINAEIGINF